MKYNIKLKLKYLSTFKPHLYTSITYNNYSVLNIRQFFYFILFINMIQSNYLNYISNKYKYSIFIFKKYKKLPVFLRAPYKHKKAQIRLKNILYCINIVYCFNYVNLDNYINSYNLIIFLSNILSFFDSPLLNLYKQTYEINTSVTIN